MNLNGIIALATLAHEGQTYGEDYDYFGYHVKGVVKLVKALTDDPKILRAAYLHDVVEDSFLTIDDLFNMGINPDVVYMVDALTKRFDETYFEYIKRCKNNKKAKLIKICDINFNFNHNCPDSLKERYLKAIDILNT